MTGLLRSGIPAAVVAGEEGGGEVEAKPARKKRGSWFDKNRHLYPSNWTEIATAVKEEAGWKCEACGNPHGPSPYVLTVDHVIDHDPSNVARENLVALCQRCHLRRQGMRPKPATKEEAIDRLRRRYEAEQGQLGLPSTGAAGLEGGRG